MAAQRRVATLVAQVAAASAASEAIENSAVVSSFCREWDAPSPDVDRMAAYFTEDVQWLADKAQRPTTGLANVKRALVLPPGMKSIGFEIVHQLATGDVVVSERVERFERGGRRYETPLTCVFRFRGGKICECREFPGLRHGAGIQQLLELLPALGPLEGRASSTVIGQMQRKLPPAHPPSREMHHVAM